jgi:hypothetical protein
MLRDPTSLDAVDPDIRNLIDKRLQELDGIVDDIHEFVTFIVVRASDTIDALDAALGFPVLSTTGQPSLAGTSSGWSLGAVGLLGLLHLLGCPHLLIIYPWAPI